MYYLYRDDTALGTGLLDQLLAALIKPGAVEAGGEKKRGYPVIDRWLSEKTLGDFMKRNMVTGHVEETLGYIRERIEFYGVEPRIYISATVPPLLHYGVRLSLLRIIYNTGVRRHIGWRHWIRPTYIVEENTYLDYASATRRRGLGYVAVYASTLMEAERLHRAASTPWFAEEAMKAITGYRHSVEAEGTVYPVIHTDYYHGLEDKLVELGIRLVDAMIAAGIHREAAEAARDIAVAQKTMYGDALQYVLGVAVLAARRQLGIGDTAAYYTFDKNLLLRPSRRVYRVFMHLGLRRREAEGSEPATTGQ